MCNAAWLPQKSCIEDGKISKDARNDQIHINSLVAKTMDRYSASAKDRDTVICSLLLQEIGDPPSITK